MKQGKTKSGFEFSYDENRLDDMRLVDVLAVVVDDESAEFDRLKSASKFLGMLLGSEMKAALYEHIGASHEGRVPYAAITAELQDIMSANIDSKN